MATYKEALETETLWRGEPTFVNVSIPLKEIRVGWNKQEEAPLKTIEFNPEKDGLSLWVGDEEKSRCYGDIILVTGSIQFYHISHIQKIRNMIQLFAEKEE